MREQKFFSFLLYRYKCTKWGVKVYKMGSISRVKVYKMGRINNVRCTKWGVKVYGIFALVHLLTYVWCRSMVAALNFIKMRVYNKSDLQLIAQALEAYRNVLSFTYSEINQLKKDDFPGITSVNDLDFRMSQTAIKHYYYDRLKQAEELIKGIKKEL